MSEPARLAGESAARERVLDWSSDRPHDFLGPHSLGDGAIVVRVASPEAVSVDVLLPAGGAVAAQRVDDRGLWAARLPDAAPDLAYRLGLGFADGSRWEREDPYRFPPTVGDQDLYLFGVGRHRHLWKSLGARWTEVRGVGGWSFSVWAPNARRVSVVGDFCLWDGRILQMRRLGTSGVFELFVPGPRSGDLYKFEIQQPDGKLLLRADPMAAWAEEPPGTASRLFRSEHVWQDSAWMEQRRKRDIRREPLLTYEVHLGSWWRDGERPPGYREVAPRLIDHVRGLGFDSIQFLPLAEHPYHGSWGYQITGYYAPTARFGSPDDFRFLVDSCHDAGIQVLLDWVPGHFVTDEHGLGRFDGTALYEHEDPRQGLHPDWGTYLFNLGRWEVKGFLLSNALYWLEEMHLDGLRVDAVASMLYLDYSRKEGEWVANKFGGRENLDSIAFLREANVTIHSTQPGCYTIAEESTAWPGVTKPPKRGGLGFDLKWNMGWMHDTLGYFGIDPLFRGGVHDRLTFAMLYEYSEAFVNPLSHDEVVHGKGSLWRKMPGGPRQKLANLRLLFAYQITRPGKTLLFMGSEVGPETEWKDDASLPWHLLDDPGRRGLRDCLAALGELYHRYAAFWQNDGDPLGFEWRQCEDRHGQVFAYERRDSTGAGVLVLLNMTPLHRKSYRLEVGREGIYELLFSSDETRFGGTGADVASRLETQRERPPLQDELSDDAVVKASGPVVLRPALPPLTALIYELPPLPKEGPPARLVSNGRGGAPSLESPPPDSPSLP